MSKLGDILQDEARAEIAGILSDADSRAETLIQEARDKASARLAAQQKRTEAQARAASRRAESAAELTVSTARIQARGRVTGSTTAWICPVRRSCPAPSTP